MINYQSLQTGTFRMNCLDCLDRTNSVQSFIALEVSLSEDLLQMSIMHTLSVAQERRENGHKPHRYESFLISLCYRMMLAVIIKLRRKGKIHSRRVIFIYFFFLLHTQILLTQLEILGLNSRSIVERFVESYKAMWTLNGHNLSKVFTGSRALEGKHKVKKSSKAVYSEVTVEKGN